MQLHVSWSRAEGELTHLEENEVMQPQTKECTWSWTRKERTRKASFHEAPEEGWLSGLVDLGPMMQTSDF